MQMQECRCLHLGTVTVPCRGQPFPSFNDTPQPEQKQQTNLFRKKNSKGHKNKMFTPSGKHPLVTHPTPPGRQ